MDALFRVPRQRRLHLLHVRPVVFGFELDQLALVGPTQPVVVEVKVHVKIEVVGLVQVIVTPRQTLVLGASEPNVKSRALVDHQDDGLELPELGDVLEEPGHVALGLNSSVEHAQVQAGM